MNGILLQIYLLHSKRYIYTYFLIYNIMYANLIIYIEILYVVTTRLAQKNLFS